MKRNRQLKLGVFKCQCGCNEDFTAEYVTRQPKYKDRKHRNRILASNKAKARSEQHMKLFAEYKKRKTALHKLGFRGPKTQAFANSLSDREFWRLMAHIEKRKNEGAIQRDDSATW